MIDKIRKSTRFVVILVALCLFFFIVQEFIRNNTFLANKTPIVGAVAGKNITLKTFQAQVEQLQRNYLMNYEQAPSEQAMAYFRKIAWKKLVTDIVYKKICQALDIQVSTEELVDMVQGEHIHADLQAAFRDPITKEFSKKDLLSFLQNISKLPPDNQTNWYQYEQGLAQTRCQDKFQQLINRSIFVTSLEARQKWIMENTVLDIRYLYIPYIQVPKEDITITSAMLKSYIQQHSIDYAVEESKEIRYTVFPIESSDKDHAEFDQELKKLKQEFEQTTEDRLFAKTHTDTNPNLVTLNCTSKELPVALSSHQSNLKKGIVIGPIPERDQIYKLYKVTNLVLQNPQTYELNIIEKRLTPSDETKEEVFRKAENFIKNIKTRAQFDAQAEQHFVHIADAKVGKEDHRIGKLDQVRELVHWLYQEGKVGKVSPIFETGDSYVTAVVIAHQKAGITPLQQVEAEVRDKVLNEQKSKKVIAQVQPLYKLPLEEIATQYGRGASIFTAQQVKFHDTYLASMGAVTKTVHRAFALAVGQRSPCIADRNGVALVEVTQRQVPTMPDSWQVQQIKQVDFEQRMQFFQLSQALDELAKVQDDRHKYY